MTVPTSHPKHPATPKHDLSSIRFVICGAAPVAAELSEQFRKLVPADTEVIQAYGMTETATAVTFVSLSDSPFFVKEHVS